VIITAESLAAAEENTKGLSTSEDSVCRSQQICMDLGNDEKRL
jgi:hypothetical protein